MSFSNEWEESYAAGTHLSIWPWSDLVSLVYRHCADLIRERGKVLELGCGDGGNLIPMAVELPGSRFTGIELAQRPAEKGRQVIRALGLGNIELPGAPLIGALVKGA